MDIEDTLKKLGLSEKEIAVYLACLETGETGIVPLRQKVSLPRTTIWHALESLRDKGLIEITETKTRRIYTPYPPRKILTLIKHQEEEIAEKASVFQQALPELNRLFQSSPFQPRVRFFRGEEIKEIYEEILNSSVNEFLYVGETNRLAEILDKKFFTGWVKKKVEKGVWTKSLRVGTDDPFFDPKKDLRKVRYAPTGFDCPAHIYIYADNVAILTSAKENFGVVTTSREYAKSMKSWFDQLWIVSTPAK